VFGTFLRKDKNAEQLANIHKRLLSHRSHALTAIDEICNKNPKGISPYQNLMNTCYVFQNYPLATDLKPTGWPQLVEEIDHSEPGSPLLIVVEPTAKAGKLRVISKDNSFDSETIERLLAEWQETLAQIISNKSRKPSSSGHETNRGEDEPAIGTQALLKKIRAVAEQEGSRDAIVTDEGTISYRELWNKVQQKSQELEDEIGSALGLVMVESTNQAQDIIHILAIWNAKKGHITVDSAIPAQESFSVYRNEEVVARLTPSGVVAKRTSTLKGNTQTRGVRQQEGNNQLAYAILTSGSTGKPKLIGISQKNLEAHRQARRHRYRKDDRILLTYPLIFDGAMTVLVSALEAGSTLVLSPKSARTNGRLAISIDQILPTIAKEQVTALNMVPSLLKSLLAHGEAGQLSSVRHLVLAAEELTGPDWKEIDSALPRELEVWNEYGPSETTICATEFRIPRKTPIKESSVPIGKAIAGCTVEVINEKGNAAKKGQKGEIWIRGAIVGQGYLGEPERTKSAFGKEQTSKGEVCTYRSGDLGYITESGDLVWSGRKDSQIKLNGVRIRTEEVEALLHSLEGTREAHSLVLEEPGGARKMTSFVSLEENQPHHQWLLDAEGVLRARQLEHNLQVLSTIPRLESGKIDGQALRQLAQAGVRKIPEATAEAEANHRGQPEAGRRVEQLKELFSEVLNQKEVDMESDLFRSGGSSLTAMTLTALARKRLGLKMEIIDVFQAPTPGALAALWDKIEAREDSREEQKPQAKKRDRWAT
jgi:acyl-coenzyme A synthetase/AMP-(fatty) acid ligase/aryl carrier-like protein